MIVKLESAEGYVGYGEAPALPYPIYKADTTDIAILVLRDYISPLVLNQEIPNVRGLMEKLSMIRGNQFSKAGIEMAFLMARLTEENKSLADMIGTTRTQVAVGESIGLQSSIEAMLDEVALRLDQGFQRIKLKIEPGDDIVLVEAVRNRFGDIPLSVDANSSYTLADTPLLKALDRYDLEMIEQPLAHDDIIDHAVLQKQLDTPICLDESIMSAEDARRAISIGACQIINIKPGRVGGVLESHKIHDVCAAHGVGVWCGGMLESGIGRAFNLAIASLPNAIYPADMSPSSFYFTDDIVDDGYTVDSDGYIQVPRRKGIGFRINERKLNVPLPI